MDYFERMVNICAERGVELVLYKIPSPIWSEAYSKVSEALAKEYGLPYLELFYVNDEIGLDTGSDFRDKKEHLNQYGAEKLSEYIVKYLKKILILRIKGRQMKDGIRI